MKPRLLTIPLLLAVSMSVLAAPTCQFERVASGPQKIGAWIDKSNWLDIDYQRVSLQAANVFMPAQRLAGSGKALPVAVSSLIPERIEVIDPLDGSKRNLEFMLDSRLYADGLVVLHKGRIVAERYRNGLRPEEPRLLLTATRPLLNLLGAIGVAQGKLTADKSVTRALPSLNSSAGLRKLSIQRLLENDERYTWPAEEIASWRQAAGWTASGSAGGIRAWLSQAERWERPLSAPDAAAVTSSPDDDLLAWALAESYGMPLSRLFCERLQQRSPPEHTVLWLNDPQGIDLADGLALSLRDFTRLGQTLLDARTSRNQSKIPGWFVETLTASAGTRSSSIKGLAKGSVERYGFVHLGGAANRVALIGSHGNSLYIDFDQRLVIGLYGTYPVASSPALLATLEQVWNAIGQVGVPPGVTATKRSKANLNIS